MVGIALQDAVLIVSLIPHSLLRSLGTRKGTVESSDRFSPAWRECFHLTRPDNNNRLTSPIGSNTLVLRSIGGTRLFVVVGAEPSHEV